MYLTGESLSGLACLLLLRSALCHPQYLNEIPNGHNLYFTSLPGDGAIGHTGDVGGARLNSFGKQYPGGDTLQSKTSKEVQRFQSCTREDFDRVTSNQADDDDDDHHHHRGTVWTLKFCCADADSDGQSNGLELGDPCCVWKKGQQPNNLTNISHPGRSYAKTVRSPCTKPVCGHEPTPPSPPYPPSPSPGIPIHCLDALNFECRSARARSAQSCLICEDEHAFVLKLAECNQTHLETYCHTNQTLGSHTDNGLKAFVQGHNARRIFTSAGWELAKNPADADLIWVRNRCYIGAYEPDVDASHGWKWQTFNMLPWDLPLTDKGMLAQNMKSVANSSRYIPTTFWLQHEKDRQQFMSEMNSCSQQESDDGNDSCGIWILKRTDLSNGLSAQILEHPAAWVLGSEAVNHSCGNSCVTFAEASSRANSWLVQKYIEDPLLLDGRKSEIRSYFLIVSLEPLVVLYNTGTVRLNAAKYQRDGHWNNDLVHITNIKRQLQIIAGQNTSAASNRGRALGLKWSHSHLAAFLETRTAVYGLEPWSVLQRNLQQILKQVIRAAWAELTTDVGNYMGTFQLFGADFIVEDQVAQDNDMRRLIPFLTEIQTGPGLSFDDPVKSNVIPNLLNTAGKIVVAYHQAQQQRQDLAQRREQLDDLVASSQVWQILINDL